MKYYFIFIQLVINAKYRLRHAVNILDYLPTISIPMQSQLAIPSELSHVLRTCLPILTLGEKAL